MGLANLLHRFDPQSTRPTVLSMVLVKGNRMNIVQRWLRSGDFGWHRHQRMFRNRRVAACYHMLRNAFDIGCIIVMFRQFDPLTAFVLTLVAVTAFDIIEMQCDSNDTDDDDETPVLAGWVVRLFAKGKTKCRVTR